MSKKHRNKKSRWRIHPIKKAKFQDSRVRPAVNLKLSKMACELCGGESTYRSRYGFCTCILTPLDYGDNKTVRLQDSAIFKARFSGRLGELGIKKTASEESRSGTKDDRLSKAPSRAKKAEFYASWEWKKARYATLQRHGHRCLSCGATPASGAIIHVDHIKPLHDFWEMRLDPENLQPLCEDCNMGKSNTDMTDYRAAAGNPENNT